MSGHAYAYLTGQGKHERSEALCQALGAKEESSQIIGACFEVYNEMGCGFLEGVYQECLAIEFRLRRIPFVAQRELVLRYKEGTCDSTHE